MPAPPRLEHVFDLDIDLVEPVGLPASGAGRHWFIEIAGGRVTGPRLSGRILPGGGDWAVERGDGTWDLDARYALVLDDGTPVEVRNRGHYVEGEAGAGPRYYLTTPWFRCPDDGPQGWLTRSVFVGEAFELGPTRIRISVHRVDHADGAQG